jgi:hypothetical protein
MGEAGSRIERAFKACRDARALGRNQVLGPLIHELRLDMATSIHDVLPDLHYLKAGSGDVAQLDHIIRIYKAGIERLIDTPELEVLYDYVERQLSVMSTLHANAERHIGPLVQRAIDGGR